MAKFTYQCPYCGSYEEIIASTRPSEGPVCAFCESPMERSLSAPKVIIKGAAAKNNYSVPPSNAELGLPSEYELSREMTKGSDHFIDPAERDLKKDYEDGKKAAKESARIKAEKVKQKNPELYAKFREAQDKVRKNLHAKGSPGKV